MTYTQEPYERETIISFDESSDMANLYTANKVWLRKMDKLVSEHPENFKVRRQETYHGKVIAKDYIFPSRFISIRTKDIKLNLTEEEKAKRAQRLKASKINSKG